MRYPSSSASDEGTGPNLLPDVGIFARPGPSATTHLEGKDGSAAANEPQSLSPESKKPKNGADNEGREEDLDAAEQPEPGAGISEWHAEPEDELEPTTQSKKCYVYCTFTREAPEDSVLSPPFGLGPF